VSAPRISGAQAESIAAAAVRARDNAAARRYFVERLDAGHAYFLIVIGAQGSPGAIVAVDAVSGEIASSARFARLDNPWLLEEKKAIEVARLPGPATARLVWGPSRASLSPLYPLWEIAAGGRSVYIDAAGKRWDELAPSGPG
jgi:hypothetical protein